MKKRVLSLLLALCLLVTILPVAALAADGTDETEPVQDVTALARAIAEADDGDTIVLDEGVFDVTTLLGYDARVGYVIEKRVNLKSTEDAVITGAIRYQFSENQQNNTLTISGITFNAKDAAATGLAFTGNVPNDGYNLNIAVSDCTFNGWRYGVGVFSHANKYALTVEDCQFNSWCALCFNYDTKTEGQMADNELVFAGSNVISASGYAVQDFSNRADAEPNVYYKTIQDFEGKTNGVGAANVTNAYYVLTAEQLTDALSNLKDNETIELLSNVTVDAAVANNDSLLTIEAVDNVTLDGNGYTITANCRNANGNVLGIKGCDGVTVKDLAITKSSSGVTVKDLAITKSSSGQAKHAINVYKSTNVTLTDVSMSNMGGLGLVVNASTVKATGTLSLYKNGWFDGLNAINVGWGSNVSAAACSFDASEATLIGVNLMYTDNGDIANANGKPFTITAPANYTQFHDAEEGKQGYVCAEAMIGETSYATLEAAVADVMDGTASGTTVELQSNVVVDETITLSKDITIDGNGYLISGEGITNTNTIVGFLVSDGTAAFQDVTLTKFDNKVDAAYGSVIKIDAGSDTAKVVTNNVQISRFSREAFSFKAGQFEINDTVINCAPWAKRPNKLTKGFQIGFGTSTATGSLNNVTVYNAESNYEKWGSSAIEIFNDAQVTINGGSISECKEGIHIDHYWAGSTSYPTLDGDISVTVNGTDITALNDALLVATKNDAVDQISVSISDGDFDGAVRIYNYDEKGETANTEKDSISITGGTFSADPSTYVASGYNVSGNGPFTVYRPSSGSGSSSGSTTETVTNPDGSTTTTVTKPDGTTTETTTDTEGNKTQVVTKPDGSSSTTVSNKDGSSSTTTVSKDGQVEAEVKLPADMVSDAAEKNETVALPMPEVPVTTDSDEAPTVTVRTGSNGSARVLIPVEDVTPGTVAILVNDDGTEEVVKTSVTTEDGVVLTVENGDTVKIVDNAIDFEDIKDTYWGLEEIAFVTSRELFTGTSATEFSPENTMTRAMIVTVLARYEGVDTSTGDEWYDVGTAWAVENGISDGTNLNGSVTREQLATMLYRYAGEPAVSGTVTGFPDAGDVSDYAVTAMAWAIENGLIGGMPDGTLKPGNTATRAQVAAILNRFVANIA